MRLWFGAVFLAACGGGQPDADGAAAADLGAVADLAAPQQGCAKDTDCKGDRLCISGACVDPPDLARAATPDLAAASPDFAELPDLALLPDVAAPPDLRPPGPRRLFIAPARPGNLGPQAIADQHCQGLADAAKLGGTFKAILFYSGSEPRDTIKLNQKRLIQAVNGSPISDDDNFWSASKHAGPMSTMADGRPHTVDCVWTGFDSLGRSAGLSICKEWLSNDPKHDGAVGNVTIQDRKWASVGGAAGCDQKCHVYCIEQ